MLNHIQAVGVTMNYDKYEVSKTQLKFLGDLTDKNGVQADAAITEAIIQLAMPQNVVEL